MANIDKRFEVITLDEFVTRIEDVEVRRIFNRDDDYAEILTIKFIDDQIAQLNRQIDKLKNEITEYNRLRGLVYSEAQKVILKQNNRGRR